MEDILRIEDNMPEPDTEPPEDNPEDEEEK